MTPIESTILKALADIATYACELGKEQAKIANFVSQRLPDATEDEKQHLLAVASNSWKQQQHLQDLASKLKTLL